VPGEFNGGEYTPPGWNIRGGAGGGTNERGRDVTGGEDDDGDHVREIADSPLIPKKTHNSSIQTPGLDELARGWKNDRFSRGRGGS
jgi:hypothetical protein